PPWLSGRAADSSNKFYYAVIVICRPWVQLG
ncbi:unnamed protein product, partial [marine sediment metagenome]